MAHFAEIGLNGIVKNIIAVNNSELLDDSGVEQEYLGRAFCYKLLKGNWIQTSFNGTFRKNFAGIGYTYDKERDAFIPPQPYPSWTLNEDTCLWNPPVPYPQDEKIYAWNEETQSWQVSQ